MREKDSKTMYDAGRPVVKMIAKLQNPADKKGSKQFAIKKNYSSSGSCQVPNEKDSKTTIETVAALAKMIANTTYTTDKPVLKKKQSWSGKRER